MPRVPINFNNTMIYKLVCKDTNITDLYVGSTTDWRTRKNVHKSDCCNENGKRYNQKKYVIIRANGGWDNWDMILVEKFPCKDSIEARKRERYWTEQLLSQMNTRRAYSSVDERKEYEIEYYQQNIDKITEYKKEWRNKNTEKIKEQMKEWHNKNPEKIKEYREKNADKIKKYSKEYYEKNADKLKEKVPCPLCNKKISRCNLSHHTKRHRPPSILYNLSPVSQENCPSLLPSPVNPP